VIATLGQYDLLATLRNQAERLNSNDFS